MNAAANSTRTASNETGVPPVPPEDSPKANLEVAGAKEGAVVAGVFLIDGVEIERVILASEVRERDRLEFLPATVGVAHMQRFGDLLYQWAGRLSTAYKGGYWEFWSLSNGGIYLVPRMDGPVPVDCDGYRGDMSPDAFGLTASLFALNALCWDSCGAAHHDLFYATRDYALNHAEARAIMRAID